MDMKAEIPVRPTKGKAFVPETLEVFDRKEMFAVLATRDNEGCPYTSLISFAFTEDLRKVVFVTPKNTRKYRNILAAKQVALLMDNRSETGGDIMETEAITISGRATALRKGGLKDTLEARFLSKHPDLEGFAKSPAAALVSVEVIEVVHVSRFQNVSVWKPLEGEVVEFDLKGRR
jgi:heme iron utilization protein